MLFNRISGGSNKFFPCITFIKTHLLRKFRDFISFSHLPEMGSARELLMQILALAKEENTDAAREFLKVYGNGE